MKNGHCFFLFTTLILLWTYFVRAESQVDMYDYDSKIYFCTKDLDVLNSVSAEIPENNNTDKLGYCVTNRLDTDFLNKIGHCFLMIAREIEGNDDFYYLKSNQAPFGYGSEDGEFTPFLPTSISDDNSDDLVSPSKRGRARIEMINPGTDVACVSVLDREDIRNKQVDVRKDKPIFYWWTVIQNYMYDDARSNLYDTFKYNCCTVASDAMKKVGGHLERINFASFSEGYGTIDKKSIGLLGFLGFSASVLSEISSASGRKALNFIFKKKHIEGSKICRNYNQKATNYSDNTEEDENKIDL